MKQLAFLGSLFVLPFVLVGQTVSGIVMDASDKEPIPYAHISLGQVVSVTNIGGEFMINMASESDTVLQVSFIGYHPQKIKIEGSIEGLKVLLEPSTTELEAVHVWTGKSLMEETFGRLMLNYNLDNLRMTSYYKEKVMNSKGILYYLAEGILDIYHPFRVSSDETVIRPIRTRKKVLREFGEDHITMITGHAYDMVNPSVWRDDSFLSEKNRKNYEFEFVGVKPFQEHNVYVVIFKPKNNKGYISGKLFIEDETFAIVRMEYQPDPSKNVFWSDVLWVEEYISLRGIYELTRVSFTGEWEEYGDDYRYESILINNNIQSFPDMPEHDISLSKRDIFFEAAENDFTDGFWTGYNFMKLTSDEQD